MNIENLQPQLIWKYFNEILSVPRPSKKEEKIIAYLEGFAQSNNLDYKKDKIGNILISKPASEGKEMVPSLIMQSHVDMVCEKNSDISFNFETDGIEAYIENGWVKAKGTTLGADNGIGIAAQLAVLADTSLKLGPIECLFTVDEETGLTGANMLEQDFFKSKILINLDSEDEGEIYIGCAGGVDTLINYPLKFRDTRNNTMGFEISVTGLTGGHSGDDINKGFGNSNKILNRILYTINKEIKIGLADFQGGNLRNAIPREAKAVIAVSNNDKVILKDIVSTLAEDIKYQYAQTEPNLTVELKKLEATPVKVLKKKHFSKLLNALYACPNGVIAMSQTIPGLVETSTNLASVHFKEEYAEIVTSQRSSVESAKTDIANAIRSTFDLIKAKVKNTDSYPGWAPNSDSEILAVAKKCYENHFSVEADVKAIHAGLECGLFLDKYPYLDMISIGPTIKGAHSPDERMEVESVDKFWKFLVDILESIK